MPPEVLVHPKYGQNPLGILLGVRIVWVLDLNGIKIIIRLRLDPIFALILLTLVQLGIEGAQIYTLVDDFQN